MSEVDTPNIAGGWLGTYYYEGSQRMSPPVRFEATFTGGSEGQFAGTIQDDSRLLGIASVSGCQTGLGVRFSKKYHKALPNGHAFRLEYTGTFAQNGRAISGTWRAVGPCSIPVPGAHGAWDAHRMWAAEEEPEALADSQANRHALREAVLA